MAEDDSAERAEDESDTEGRKRRERARPVAVTGEEDLTEDQCCDDSLEKEVVPFDDGTDERSGCRAAGAPCPVRIGSHLVFDVVHRFSPELVFGLLPAVLAWSALRI